MSQLGVTNSTLSRHLWFVGAFNSDLAQVIHDDFNTRNLMLPVPDNVEIEFISEPEFNQRIRNSIFGQQRTPKGNKNRLQVIVTSAEVIFSSAGKNLESCFIISCHENSQADIFLGASFSAKNLASAIAIGFEYLLNKQQIQQLNQDVATATRERKELGEIGIALSSEKDLDKLLDKVLREGRKLGNCEAASLYLLVNTQSDNPKLLFKLTQNSKINFDFKEKHFPLTNQSLAGYVALTGEILNIADAYQLPHSLPYQFDKSFDKATGYRTRQLLVLPMTNHKRKIIGVLQFINHQDQHEALTGGAGFTAERQELLLSLASQAAVAIDNSQLIDNIQSLFEGFVAASVKAIESRDPVTSGHSFRVAEFTTGLAECLDKNQLGKYKDITFSAAQLREIRYASLLHDFGKVGVKEHVLLKANKLQDSRANYLLLKIEWQKQLLQRKFYQKLVAENEPELIKNWQSSHLFLKMQSELEKLAGFQEILMRANKPSLLEAKVAEELNYLLEYQMDDSYPFGKTLLSEDDFLSLSVTKGSLTPEERAEIQSHVVHTEAFLNQIPWTDELGGVPTIAASHHEKLDGTGYPKGSFEADIPVASKIMAIADIYDALTARDRPYKKAVQIELALDILKDEASNGKLCQTMVDTFIEAKVYQKIHS
ncbi:HD family phosphohydrolase [Aliikangiella coralliicola]|uniref:GAF domain-containing protein n=1 Tax=Aliikangiella coralliicola TaxID=2592383 RepID=A0A545U6A9_9GAMM|nr:HD family phosphohydrolase [Aliikangiella coralliicola]TQV85010.1 GAF domain-containing protein [Aliikangiella coralliicola]